MSRFEEGMQLIETCCGNGKDNVIALSTIAAEPNAQGEPCPCVRDVDAFYADGTWYIVTYGLSNKMQQIAKNKQVAFVVPFEGISGTGTAENLGWVLDPSNKEIREKLRTVFAAWYDAANNEQDENCVILAVHFTNVRIFRDHGAVFYNLDPVNKVEIQ